MNNKIVIGLIVCALVIGGVFLFRKSQSAEVQNSSDNAAVSTQSETVPSENQNTPGQNNTQGANTASADFFVTEQAELDTEMKSLQSDMNQLDEQSYEGDIKNLEEVK